jgi:hypothetical protein
MQTSQMAQQVTSQPQMPPLASDERGSSSFFSRLGGRSQLSVS